MLTLLFSLLAGVLSTLSPCVLPIVPILVSSALQGTRMGPLALLAGVVLSYTLVGTALAVFGTALGLDAGVLRLAAAVLMLLFGLSLLLPRLHQMLIRLLAPLTAGAQQRMAGFRADGVLGQGLLGLMLGVVWSPCVGPTLGAAVTLAASGHSTLAAMGTMAVFGIGAALPMGLLALGSRAALARRRQTLAHVGSIGKRVMGLALVAVALLVLSGADHWLEALLTRHSPAWLLELTTRF